MGVYTKYGLRQDLMWTDAEWSIAKFYGMLSMCAICSPKNKCIFECRIKSVPMKIDYII